MPVDLSNIFPSRSEPSETSMAETVTMTMHAFAIAVSAMNAHKKQASELQQTLSSVSVFAVNDLSRLKQLQKIINAVQDSYCEVVTQQHKLKELITDEGVRMMQESGKSFMAACGNYAYSLTITKEGYYQIKNDNDTY